MDCYLMRYGSSGFNLPTIVSDTFNRADGFLGNADTGQAWLTGGSATNAWVVGSNVAKRFNATTSTSDIAYIDIGKFDVILSADITMTTFSNGTTLLARISGTNADDCIRFDLSDIGILYCARVISGNQTILAQATYSFVSGSTYHLECSCRGNIFTAYLDGVLKISVEDDNALKTNTKVGMFLPCSNVNYDWIDNFVARG